MQEYTMTDLFRLTRAELLRLDYQMVVALARLPEFCEERTIAFLNLRLIRRELGRRDFAPH